MHSVKTHRSGFWRVVCQKTCLFKKNYTVIIKNYEVKQIFNKFPEREAHTDDWSLLCTSSSSVADWSSPARRSTQSGGTGRSRWSSCAPGTRFSSISTPAHRTRCSSLTRRAGITRWPRWTCKRSKYCSTIGLHNKVEFNDIVWHTISMLYRPPRGCRPPDFRWHPSSDPIQTPSSRVRHP